MSDPADPDPKKSGAGASRPGAADPRARSQGGPRDRLVATLVDDLRPVRRLGTPWSRAAGWLAVVSAIILVLAWFADMPSIEHKLRSDIDMWLPVVGSGLTAILAAFAAFQLDMPDRSPLWALLPLPGVILWISASGMGCAPVMMIGGAPDDAMHQSLRSIKVIVGISLPLSIVILTMLRRGYSLYPALTGAVAGLGVAAAATTMLNLFHPVDTAILYLAVEFTTVGLIVAVNHFLGRWIFRARMRR